MRYYLSAHQRKELANGKILRIALPYPDQGIPGAQRHHDSTGQMSEAALAAWLADMLDTAGVSYDCGWIGIVEVPVDPLSRSSGLGALVGNIVDPLNYSLTDEIVVRIVCVVAEIAARRAPRALYPTRWPGSVALPRKGRLP